MADAHLQNEGLLQPDDNQFQSNQSSDMAKPTTAMTADDKKSRKRQLDRISQRRKRQKDRETMERLKKSLENPDDPSMLHSLILKQEQDFARQSRHEQRMLQIKALVQADLADVDESHSAQQESQSPSDDNFDLQPITMDTMDLKGRLPLLPPTMQAIEAPLQAPSHIDLDGLSWDDDEMHHMGDSIMTSCLVGHDSSMNGFIHDVPSNHVHEPHMIHASAAQSLRSSDPLHQRDESITQAVILPQDAHSCRKCESLWKQTNINLALARQYHRATKDLYFASDNEDIDAHMIITAITDGWAAVERTPYWNDFWKTLRNIEQLCYKRSGEMERLVVLYNLVRMIKHLYTCADPEKLPRFLHERPSQQAIPHAVVVDHFVWPGVREHVLFNHQRYCSDKFSDIFRHSFRFVWPYELRDTYVRNNATKMCHFSSTFLEQSDNIHAYTLDSSFFMKYSEFRGDAPMYESLPRIPPSIDTGKSVLQFFPTMQSARSILQSQSKQIEEIENEPA